MLTKPRYVALRSTPIGRSGERFKKLSPEGCGRTRDAKPVGGEIWGFVGANGAGRTTTLSMLAGILTPDGGAGHVLGFDLQRDAARIRERVGYMSQRLSLYAELSVFQNLRFRAEVYGLKNPWAEVEAAIREFGLVQWSHSPAGALSGGWARRLQLAASLSHSPRLVLLDEPTAGGSVREVQQKPLSRTVMVCG